MTTKGRFLTIGTAVVALLVGSSAMAQLTKEEQKCLDCYNNKLRLVGQQAGKDYRSCIKNAGKGKEPNPNQCVTNDTPAKIAGKVAKVSECYSSGKCNGSEPIQQGAATGSSAYIASSQDLVYDLFDNPISGVVSPGKPEAKCQDKANQRAGQLFTEKLKVHRKCKKDGMKAGTVTNSANLAINCMLPTIPDPSGKIAKKAQKLIDDVNAACTGLTIATLFPGECAASANTAALGACIERQVECRVCEALNAADGTSVDCDLFDDGLANGTCGVVLGPPIGSHKCTLAPTSQIDIKGALPLPPLPATGAIDIDCAGTNPIDGKAACDCSVQAPGFGGLNIAGLFYACVKPAVSGSCPTGEIDCDGGNSLGVAMNGERNIGPCTSNADCTTQCAAQCGGIANVFGGAGACEGFCTDGAQSACLTDAACAGLSEGSCNGPDGVGLGNVCDCNCLNAAVGPASPAGTLQCQLAFNLTVEPIPGNGMVCDGADVSINVGDTCAPLSTQSSTSTLVNLNNGGTTIGPFADTGTAANCASLAASTTSGVSLVGSTIFYASTIGDLDTLLTVDCQ